MSRPRQPRQPIGRWIEIYFDPNAAILESVSSQAFSPQRPRNGRQASSRSNRRSRDTTHTGQYAAPCHRKRARHCCGIGGHLGGSPQSSVARTGPLPSRSAFAASWMIFQRGVVRREKAAPRLARSLVANQPVSPAECSEGRPSPPSRSRCAVFFVKIPGVS